PVAVSFETFAKYQADEAWTWERLALTRARVVAGPAALRARVEGVIQAALTKPRDKAQIVADVADMRGRLDRERPARSPWDLKEAKGGLFDVEFIVQGLQLVHGVLNVNTLGVLAAFAERKVLGEDDVQALTEAARLYLNVTQVLRLTVDGPFNPAEASSSLQALIARVAGFGLFEDVERALSGIELDTRARFARLIAPVPA
ncbi:MAG: bifunctional [glutamine synthetase] adenylyltransferase/[glutamine synthetase]-adenylyl-L-tyrosine phosphorylase, partial [Micropepsaceae bacterium]